MHFQRSKYDKNMNTVMLPEEKGKYIFEQGEATQYDLSL